jgi:YHS domain-containing protein
MSYIPRSILAGVVLLVIAAAAAQAQQAGEKGKAGVQPAAKAPVLCPVTNQPVDRNIVTRYRNRWVYFANQDALQKFEKDPTKYADGLKAQWEADKPLRVQVKCPVTGETPKPDIYVGKGEDAVFFASDEAKQKWLKDSQPYQKKLDDECYTYQTICVTDGSVIDPAASREVDGKTIYFCCPACYDAFMKDKAANLKAVDEQIKANRTAWIGHVLQEKLAEAAKASKKGEGKPVEVKKEQPQKAEGGAKP